MSMLFLYIIYPASSPLKFLILRGIKMKTEAKKNDAVSVRILALGKNSKEIYVGNWLTGMSQKCRDYSKKQDTKVVVFSFNGTELFSFDSLGGEKCQS